MATEKPAAGTSSASPAWLPGAHPCALLQHVVRGLLAAGAGRPPCVTARCRSLLALHAASPVWLYRVEVSGLL